MIGIFALLVPVALVAALVWAVRAAARRAGGEERPGLSLRRGIQYPFLLGVLFAWTSGLSLLPRSALPEPGRLAATSARDVALGLSLTVVAGPVWLLLWQRLRRRLLDDPGERASAAWLLYLAVAATVSLVIAFSEVLGVGVWLVGVEAYSSAAVAGALVWTAVWGLHAWLLHRPALAPRGPHTDVVALAGALVGAVGLAFGLGGVTFAAFRAVYRALVGGVLAAPDGSRLLRSSVVVLAVALAVWWWHWLRDAGQQGREGRPPRSGLWHGYVLLVPILGGLLAAVGSAAVALHAVLQWNLGVPDASTAAVHFELLPGVLATFVVGSAAWLYHRLVLRDVAGRPRTEPERAYEYLVAAVGLLSSAGGVTVTIVALLQTLLPPVAGADPGGRNTLVVAVTLLLVGTPVWAVFWRRVQGLVRAGGEGEVTSPVRRTYLFLLFGAVGLTAATSLVVALFVVFRDLLEGGFAAGTILEVRTALALVVTAGVVSVYHWTVYRSDRARQPEKVEPRLRTVLLVSPDGRALAQEVAALTGARVLALHRLDRPSGDESRPDAAAIAGALSPVAHERVLVIADGADAVTVIPYE